MKRILLLLVLALFACGAEDAPTQVDFFPEDETADTEYDDTEYDDTDLGVARQAFGTPLNYGMVQGTNGNICTAGGGRCLVPRDKKMRPKCTGDVTFAAGFTLCEMVNLEVNSVCSIVLNPRGWDCALTTGSSNEGIKFGSCGGSSGGCMSPGNINAQLFSQHGITYQQFNSCATNISRANIELNAGYQAASLNGKKQIVRDTIKHELGHCAGLPHNGNQLMGNPSFGGSFTFSELDAFQTYSP